MKDWTIFNGNEGNMEQNEKYNPYPSAPKAKADSVTLGCINDPNISIQRSYAIEARGKWLYHKAQYS